MKICDSLLAETSMNSFLQYSLICTVKKRSKISKMAWKSLDAWLLKLVPKHYVLEWSPRRRNENQQHYWKEHFWIFKVIWHLLPLARPTTGIGSPTSLDLTVLLVIWDKGDLCDPCVQLLLYPLSFWLTTTPLFDSLRFPEDEDDKMNKYINFRNLPASLNIFNQRHITQTCYHLYSLGGDFMPIPRDSSNVLSQPPKHPSYLQKQNTNQNHSFINTVSHTFWWCTHIIYMKCNYKRKIRTPVEYMVAQILF